MNTWIRILRKLLWPIVPVYYLSTWVRNFLYDRGLKSSMSYDFPVIAVGNLSVGGTGKSPMVEYLIRVLKDAYVLATLSRGYKRATTGFKAVQLLDTAKAVGDEPLQFKLKYPSIHVAVDANRQEGIAKLQTLNPKPELIILDDAYQHRKVTAGLYIVLTSYYDLYSEDIVLPVGNLREPKQGARRAHIIVVTKCPKDLSEDEQSSIAKRLGIAAHQSLFFSRIAYEPMITNGGIRNPIAMLQGQPFTLVTGIANPKPLVTYYEQLGLEFTHLAYPDHHHFTAKELEHLKNKGLIVTTEKDYVRLADELSSVSLWYQPITTMFLNHGQQFDALITNFIQSYEN